jgi:hypothetical protein
MFKKVQGSQSQSNQESFVLNMLDFKRNGTYVEIGAQDPFTISNTYVLEKDYDWSGFSVEINKFWADKFSSRKNPCLCANALSLDYLKIFQDHNMPKQIDYLQIDIEPAINTLNALKRMPFNDYRFSVITFEHDLYVNKNKNQTIKEEAIDILKSHGYVLAANNILSPQNQPFEDWFVDPQAVSMNKLVIGENPIFE